MEGEEEQVVVGWQCCYLQNIHFHPVSGGTYSFVLYIRLRKDGAVHFIHKTKWTGLGGGDGDGMQEGLQCWRASSLKFLSFLNNA